MKHNLVWFALANIVVGVGGAATAIDWLDKRDGGPNTGHEVPDDSKATEPWVDPFVADALAAKAALLVESFVAEVRIEQVTEKGADGNDVTRHRLQDRRTYTIRRLRKIEYREEVWNERLKSDAIDEVKPLPINTETFGYSDNGKTISFWVDLSGEAGTTDAFVLGAVFEYDLPAPRVFEFGSKRVNEIANATSYWTPIKYYIRHLDVLVWSPNLNLYAPLHESAGAKRYGKHEYCEADEYETSSGTPAAACGLYGNWAELRPGDEAGVFVGWR